MRVPEIILPGLVRAFNQRMPSMPPRAVLVLVLNQMLRRGILPADMEKLAGKTFEIHVLDAGLTLRFTADERKFLLAPLAPQPDLLFAANAADFARIMLREEDPDTLFFKRRLQIEGDTELGLIVKNLFDSIDWASIPWSRFFMPAG